MMSLVLRISIIISILISYNNGPHMYTNPLPTSFISQPNNPYQTIIPSSYNTINPFMMHTNYNYNCGQNRINSDYYSTGYYTTPISYYPHYLNPMNNCGLYSTMYDNYMRTGIANRLGIGMYGLRNLKLKELKNN